MRKSLGGCLEQILKPDHGTSPGLERQLATALGSVFESDYAERRECLKNFELRISVALGKMGSSQIDHIPALSKSCRCQFPARGLQEAIEQSILYCWLFLDSVLWILPYQDRL